MTIAIRSAPRAISKRASSKIGSRTGKRGSSRRQTVQDSAEIMLPTSSRGVIKIGENLTEQGQQARWFSGQRSGYLGSFTSGQGRSRGNRLGCCVGISVCGSWSSCARHQEKLSSALGNDLTYVAPYPPAMVLPWHTNEFKVIITDSGSYGLTCFI